MTEQVHLLMNEDLNGEGEGRLFGGRLLSWIDEVAAIVAKRHCGMSVTTAAIDNLQFKEAAHLNDIVVIIGKATYVGNTSMEIRVDSYVEAQDGKRHPINRAYLTVVALDMNGKPAQIPKLIVENEAQRAEWEGAERRIHYRRERRMEGF